jgi:hypothetical protein
LFQHGFEIFIDLFLVLLLFFGIEFFQIQFAFGDRLHVLVVELGQTGDQPFIDAVAQ